MPRRRARGHGKNARKVFGTPPRDCPTCGGNGMVLDTRVRPDSISRRHACSKGHKWSSAQILVVGSRMGVKNIDVANESLRRGLIDSLIAELKAMRP